MIDTLIKIFISAFVMFMIFTPSGLSAEEQIYQKKRIAVLNFNANRTSEEYAETVREFFEVHLYKTGVFDLLERRRIDVVIKGLGAETAQCGDVECALMIGKLLKVDFVTIGSLNRLGGFAITVKFIDVTAGTVAYADFDKAGSEDEIDGALKRLADRAAGKVVDKKPDKIEQNPLLVRQEQKKPEMIGPTALGYFLRSAVPGWGQIYTGNTWRGIIYAGAFALAGGYTWYRINDFNRKRHEYESLSPVYSSPVEYRLRHNEADKALLHANISIGIWIAAYSINWIDAIFLSRPVFTGGLAERTDRQNRFFSVNVNSDSLSGMMLSASCGIRF
jgi:hypothetical protein